MRGWTGWRFTIRLGSVGWARTLGEAALAVGFGAAWAGSVGLLAAAVALAAEAAWQAGQEWEYEIVIEFPVAPAPLYRAVARLLRGGPKKK